MATSLKILLDITHPAHVHFFRNSIAEWKGRGHKIAIATRKKDIATELLDAYGWDYEILSSAGSGLSGLGKELITRNFRLWKMARRFKPDVMAAIGGVYIAHVGALIRKPSVVFTDTENATLSNKITYPFASVVCTPTCFEAPVPEKIHVQYPGYHELAYTHPKRFTPDPEVLKIYGVKPNENFTFVRLVSWGSAHDVTDSGFSDIVSAIKELEKYGKVLISAESGVPDELKANLVSVRPELVHHVLYYAGILVGESATMASEAATLGTPAIFISTSTRGYTNELEKKYGLTWTFSEPESAQRLGLEKVLEILKENLPKSHWHEKRDKMLRDKIDVTGFITNTVEQYGSRKEDYSTLRKQANSM